MKFVCDGCGKVLLPDNTIVGSVEGYQGGITFHCEPCHKRKALG